MSISAKMSLTCMFALMFSMSAIHSTFSGTPKNIDEGDLKLVSSHRGDDKVLDAFLAKLPTVKVKRGNTMRNYYVWEGDILLNRDAIAAAVANYGKKPPPKAKSAELLVMTDQSGNSVFWPRGQRHLTYGIDRASFPSQAAYQQVVSNMQDAAGAWQKACTTCDLRISYDAQASQPAPTGSGLTFIVRYDRNITEFIAASFFPNDPIDNRVLIVAPEYFTTPVDHVGVFRHEIGHILGYRHEHIQGIPGCGSEDEHWKQITPYDRVSVMHYLCGNGGTMKMVLSDKDIQGHTLLYGGP